MTSRNIPKKSYRIKFAVRHTISVDNDTLRPLTGLLEKGHQTLGDRLGHVDDVLSTLLLNLYI